jgi:tetratricopeptide (TPR) repeat protein
MDMAHVLMWRIIAVIAALFTVGLLIWRQMGGGKPSEDDADEDSDEEGQRNSAVHTRSRSTGPLPRAEDKSSPRGQRLSPDPAAGAAPPPSPSELAEQAERKFRKALAGEASDLAPSALLRTFAETAAQAWLALGDIRRVAEVYRDARIFDKALKLYVNTLKDYPEAAIVASRKGDHARAAQLYTYLGDKDKALASWLEWGRTAVNPLQYGKEMRAFGEEQFANVLVRIIETRPASEKDAELLYRLAGALDEGGFPQAALRVFARLAEVVPNYKDVAACRAQLEQRVADEARNSSPLDADGGGLFDPLALPSAPFQSEPPQELLELPCIEDEPEQPAAEEAAAAPDDSQTEPLVKSALASLALVKASRRARKDVVEEHVSRPRHDNR